MTFSGQHMSARFHLPKGGNKATMHNTLAPQVYRQVERRSQRAFLMFLIPAVVLLFLFFIVPIVVFLAQSVLDPDWTTRHFEKFANNEIYLRVLLRTLKVSFLTAFLCLLLGYPVAYVMAKTRGRMRMFIMALVLIPFWTNVLARMFAWIVLLGKQGFVNSTLISMGLVNEPLSILFSELAVLIGMVHYMLPYMILPLMAVMVSIPGNLTDAAENLGASPFRAFWHVFLPLSVPGIAAGWLMVFIISLGFYVTPALLGGPKDVLLAQVIEFQISGTLNWGFAAALSLVLLITTFVLYAIYLRITDKEGA